MRGIGVREPPLSASEAEERAQFTLAMRTRSIHDLGLLRALERVPRSLFMPQRFADMSGRDIALPIGCGQSSPTPSVLTSMIAALEVGPTDRICEIGTGSGYCTALLAQLAGEVVTLERFQTLSVEACDPTRGLRPHKRQGVVAGRIRLHQTGERFDKVIVHGLIDPPALDFVKLIAAEGLVSAVLAGPARVEQKVVRLTVPATGPVAMSEHGAARALRPLERGLARAL